MTTKFQRREILIALIVGALFGGGLLVSGMANPGKVLAFLDVFGNWDPSLALVMGSAVAVGLIGFPIGSQQTESVLGLTMRMPTARDIDAPLVIGSIAFGVGWGLVGLCPGPALVALATGSGEAITFVVSMLVGMAVFDWKLFQRGDGK